MTKNINKIKQHYEIVKGDQFIWKPRNRITSTRADLETCPKCSGKLGDGCSLIPIGRDEYVKIKGKDCVNCDTLFVKDGRDIVDMLMDNTLAKHISYNGKKYWDHSCRIEQNYLRDILDKAESALMIIKISIENTEKTFLIVANENGSIADKKVEVVHYSSYIARELLTAQYHVSRDKRGTLEGQDYRIIDVMFKNRRDNENIEQVIPSEILIKSGGGCSYAIKNNRSEIVIMLFYSPYAKMYEVTHATLNKNTGVCYMDIRKYREFIAKHGNPSVQIKVDKSDVISDRRFDDFKTESLLHAYGYSTSVEKGLTEKERRKILTEIVDLELLTVDQITHYLNFFIETRKAEKYMHARFKWKRDLDFIQNYKIKPKRFLVLDETTSCD